MTLKTLPSHELIVAYLSLSSLIFHLLSLGDLDDDWYNSGGLIASCSFFLHALCNFITEVCLLSTSVLLILQQKRPDILTLLFEQVSQLDKKSLMDYATKLSISAAVSMMVRFKLPGPLESFPLCYKISMAVNLVSIVMSSLDFSSFRKLSITESDGSESDRSSISSEGPELQLTKRQRTAMELMQTETSYLRNLNTILKVYKEPLEKAVEDGTPILASEDIRQIFGEFDALHEVHTCIHNDLKELIDNWSEDCCIAEIVNKYSDKLLKVYPPYVNYFEKGKEVIFKEEKNNPLFKEFLTNCLNSPQSLKQPLEALLIRPVQRLPSVSLLINDLHKRTPENLRDYQELIASKEALKKVLSHINEDKRKTEGKMKIFDIVYEVDGCPVDMVSSNRTFISRLEVVTLSEGLYRAGERLALYLLNDKLEVAKWRNRSHGKDAPLLKHIQLLPLENITDVYDIEDNDECRNIMAVAYNAPKTYIENSTVPSPEVERLSILQIFDGKHYKQSFLKNLSKQVEEVTGKTEILKKTEPYQLANRVKKGSKLHKKMSKQKVKAG